jgi:hypothetical protein
MRTISIVLYAIAVAILLGRGTPSSAAVSNLLVNGG